VGGGVFPLTTTKKVERAKVKGKGAAAVMTTKKWPLAWKEKHREMGGLSKRIKNRRPEVDADGNKGLKLCGTGAGFNGGNGSEEQRRERAKSG